MLYIVISILREENNYRHLHYNYQNLVTTHLLLPDRQLRQLKGLIRAKFVAFGLDLAIQAEPSGRKQPLKSVIQLPKIVIQPSKTAIQASKSAIRPFLPSSDLGELGFGIVSKHVQAP
jgi:hypothetical protein